MIASAAGGRFRKESADSERRGAGVSAMWIVAWALYYEVRRPGGSCSSGRCPTSMWDRQVAAFAPNYRVILRQARLWQDDLDGAYRRVRDTVAAGASRAGADIRRGAINGGAQARFTGASSGWAGWSSGAGVA
jgi:hypothetical protein